VISLVANSGFVAKLSFKLERADECVRGGIRDRRPTPTHAITLSPSSDRRNGENPRKR
jgi:hypothetical protein